MADQPTTPSPASPTAAPARQGAPRQQSRGRRRQKSRFGTQMEEKQNLKAIYGIREGQLRRYYQEALKAGGQTGPTIITLLEQRLDNVLYRGGFAETRKASRQMATHGHVQINGRAVDVPSVRLLPGDVITIKESKRKKKLYENWQKHLQNVSTPSWLVIDPEQYSLKVTAAPTADEANIGIDIRAVVEYFAR